MKLSVQKIQIFLAVSLTFLSSIDVQAQSANPNGQLNQSLIFAAPPPPKDIGEPGKRTEAGSRGCGQDINKPLTSSQKRLTALVPVYSNSELVFGTTITEHPSFVFYVPYPSDFASGEFVLEDEAGDQTSYKTSLTGTPGIVNLRLPSIAAPLEIGKQYRWYFNIYCQKDNQIIANVEGYVKREQLKPALKTQLEKSSPSQQVNLYAANGIWYEALSAASELRRTNSQDTSWTALLKAVGLNDFATEPKVECCNLEN
ncbi:DUF928 domain-containing protein [Nostoc sphaeroides]|uniref:DUF928 domain-containing protein n=1 Tax=Nostoc sphaeroides CCNUC1 TaxID=2653204 RepID=A0A5P8W7Q2_9NOSO|nr:DUF928 domain-containing protein [Nostoc sphaeroides]MCC5626999.1 DUF928 domain-containing protein [Nostoc sphaeroides CHAB 2801]QFS48684.1 hypothetical protein GXM_06178 [Nostoc sphaeroides CCNUC1]